MVSLICNDPLDDIGTTTKLESQFGFKSFYSVFALTFNQSVGNAVFLERVFTCLCLALWKGVSMAESKAQFISKGINIETDFFLFDNSAKFYEYYPIYKYLFNKQIQVMFNDKVKNKVIEMKLCDEDLAPHALKIAYNYYESNPDYKLPILISFKRSNDEKMT